ncbi:hypothetical protein GCK72_022352 [Caenorhabditis remanei]|uniref:DNA-directed DNA polymerase n=1 Tax=Caenorhabditis remanei TaxID=31234 RepID=A0A6A5FTU0_CAERE|nr:hypothetical protein GCK72_022352 [Caenorhabditis remanei]KAF1745905.1 hypothetical protein GCK72_022352 [Caenorhabditis remanei]
MDADLTEIIEDLIQQVVENEDWRIGTDDENTALDRPEEIDERRLPYGEEHARRLQYILGNEEEEVDEELEQVGGAAVKVINVHHEKHEGDYEKYFKTVTLTVKLSDAITVDPHGPETFGETIVELVKKFQPDHVNDTTKVGITFKSLELDAAEAVGLSLTPLKMVTGEKVVYNLELMTQSNKSPLEIQNPTLDIILKYVVPPSGSGKRKSGFSMRDILDSDMFGKRRRVNSDGEMMDDDDEDDLIMDEAVEVDDSEDEAPDMDADDDDDDGPVVSRRGKKSVIMKNEVIYDCLFHAVYQSLMFLLKKHGVTHDERQHAARMYRQSLKKSDSTPNQCLTVYVENSGITKRQNFDHDDIKQLQETVFAGTHQIIAIVKDQPQPFFAGPYVGENKTIPIYLEEIDGIGHFSGVRALPTLLKTKFFCNQCLVRCGSFATHYNCPLRHRPCGSMECPSTPNDMEFCCVKCEMLFRSKKCLDNHLAKGSKRGKSRCDHTKLCKKCGEVYYTNKTKITAPHDCGLKWCTRCNMKMTPEHKCIMAISVKKTNLTYLRFACDFECMFDPITRKHKPVLFVALRYCPDCSATMPKTVEEALGLFCPKCSPDGRCKLIDCISVDNRFVNVAEEAAEWIFAQHNKGFVGLAHNGSGYDWQFILNYLISKTKATPTVVTAGTKIIFIQHKNVKLLDSYKYLTMSLAAIGKAFNIPVQKGEFPFLFIKPENFDYDGVMPGNEFYNLENKTPAAREKIIKFLDEARAQHHQFNFESEIKKYCFEDVFILASALIPFEKDFEELTNVCLFEESITAASAAMKTFQRKHLTHEKPIVLDARPSVSIKCSVISQKYLAWFGKEEDVEVEMSTTFGERKVGKYRVDGFVSPCARFPRGLVIEFFGCYFHAHKCKYADQSLIGSKVAIDIRNSDAKRIEELEVSHDVKVVWECEVEKERRMNAEMANFFNDYEPLGMLDCERALTGGRTEVFKLTVTNKRVRKHFGDVVSLYPTVMKFEEFPIGAPTNVRRSEYTVPLTDPSEIRFKGFIACRVGAPKDLKVPLLGLKTGGKLFFALCLECVKTNNQLRCTHSDKERSFNGVFTTAELKKALELGYVIIEIHHAIKYDNWATNDADGAGGLFTSYINEMMAGKIYASGWPEDVTTPEEQDAFIASYMAQGIDVSDKSKFNLSPPRRLATKLLVNSLWGKMAQRVDRAVTEIVVTPAKFWKIYYDTSIVIEDFWTVNNTVMMRTTKQAETLKSLKTGAVHIAAYVTSYARLRLYKLMEKVGAENLIYTDTDSIAYTVPLNAVDPLKDEYGPFLGQLTNELKGVMTEFVSLGPKTYCYKQTLEDGTEQVVRKAKGLTLTSEADKRVTFDIMKKMVEDVLAQAPGTVVRVPQQVMKRDRLHNIYSGSQQKMLRYTFNKRRVLQDGSTLPLGYCD